MKQVSQNYRTGKIALESLFDTTLTTLANVESVQTTSVVEMDGFFSLEQE